MDAPGYTKPAHGYGQAFPDWGVPQWAEIEEFFGQPRSESDPDWAGKGFTERDEESTT